MNQNILGITKHTKTNSLKMNKQEAKQLSARINALVSDLEKAEEKLECIKASVEYDSNLSFNVKYRNKRGNSEEATVYASSETSKKIRQLLIEQYEQSIKTYTEKLDGLSVYNLNNITN